MNYGSLVLPNGVKIIYYNDNNRKTSYAELLVDYGALNKKFDIGNTTYEIKDGTAHYLEHLTIEHSKTGNLLEHFKNQSVLFNGITSTLQTRFYINTVTDFEKHLENLIYSINDADFTKENILNTKGPIIEEARTTYNQQFFKFREEYNSNYLNPDYRSVIGNLDDLKDMDYDYLKRVYDTYYVPSNQTILLGGNFDLERCKKIISQAYQKVKRKYISSQNIKRSNMSNILNKNIDIVSPKDEDYVEVIFKIGIKDFNPEERLKLDYYYHYIINKLFDDRSKLFKFLIDNKYTVYSIVRHCTLIDDYLYLGIGAFTIEDKIFTEKVLEEIKNFKPDKEDFNTFIKSTIITILLRKENYKFSLLNYSSNILNFGIDLIEDAKFINQLNIDEMNFLVGRLDFSNYGIIKQRKE